MIAPRDDAHTRDGHRILRHGIHVRIVNHLAHALLSDGLDAEFALGSAEGDFVHGAPDTRWPRTRQAGLRFHRAIDRYTDTHADVVAARRLFAPPMRRYAGIVLDVWFDHLLVRAWDRLVPTEPLDAFCARWLALLDANAATLPEAQRGFVAWMHAHGLPARYGDEATLDVVFNGLARRLSRPAPIGAALPTLRAHASALQTRFDAFWPDLVAQARSLRASANYLT